MARVTKEKRRKLLMQKSNEQMNETKGTSANEIHAKINSAHIVVTKINPHTKKSVQKSTPYTKFLQE